MISTTILIKLTKFYNSNPDFTPTAVEQKHPPSAAVARWLRAVYDLRLAAEKGPGGSLDPMLPLTAITTPATDTTQ